MKTAISLPDDLFELAEDFARDRGISRSALFTTALREYLLVHRTDALTERINAVCAEVDTRLPDDLANVARRKLLEAEW